MSISEFKLSWPMIAKRLRVLDGWAYALRGVHLKESYVDFIKNSYEKGMADDYTNVEDFLSACNLVWSDHREEFDKENKK